MRTCDAALTAGAPLRVNNPVLKSIRSTVAVAFGPGTVNVPPGPTILYPDVNPVTSKIGDAGKFPRCQAVTFEPVETNSRNSPYLRGSAAKNWIWNDASSAPPIRSNFGSPSPVTSAYRTPVSVDTTMRRSP